MWFVVVDYFDVEFVFVDEFFDDGVGVDFFVDEDDVVVEGVVVVYY